MATFPERLKKLRNEMSLTQKQLGERIGLSESTIGMYERGEREPSFEISKRIADFFDVERPYLLGDTNKRNEEQDEFEDPELGLWFKELKEASPERQAEMRRFWEFIKQQEKDRKPGDKQGE